MRAVAFAILALAVAFDNNDYESPSWLAIVLFFGAVFAAIGCAIAGV